MADLLWHYTTGAGLRGILEKNLLWATDVRYMNDESELNYPVSLLDEAFDEGLGRLPDDVTKTWISTLRQQLERFETIAVFATCFCRGGPNHGELLAMWRAYGSRTGYSIGFHPEAIEFLLPMISNRAQQRIDIIDLLVQFYAAAKSLYPTYAPGDPRIEEHELELLSAIAVKMVRIKHPAFEEEMEVRRSFFYSLRRDPPEAIKFRDGGSLGFLPYREVGRVDFDGVDGQLPIERIIIGPTMHPALAERGLRMLLRKTGFTNVEVARSAIPLRAAAPSGTT